MNYVDWLKTVPVEIRADPLWNQEAYRLALFAADLGWHDTRGYALHEGDSPDTLIADCDRMEPLTGDELQKLLDSAPMPEP
jgi:hypothetical protein